MEAELLQIRAGTIPIAIAVIDCDEGSMVRFEKRAGRTTRTHRCAVEDDHPRPVEFPFDLVNNFRKYPPGEFSLLGPAPVPGGDSPGSPAAAARAA